MLHPWRRVRRRVQAFLVVRARVFALASPLVIYRLLLDLVGSKFCRFREDPFRERLVLQQEVLVEGAEPPIRVDNCDLEHPEVGVRPEVDVGERAVVMRGVGEIAQAVAREGHVELPAESFGRFLRVCIELLARLFCLEPAPRTSSQMVLASCLARW